MATGMTNRSRREIIWSRWSTLKRLEPRSFASTDPALHNLENTARLALEFQILGVQLSPRFQFMRLGKWNVMRNNIVGFGLHMPAALSIYSTSLICGRADRACSSS